MRSRFQQPTIMVKAQNQTLHQEQPLVRLLLVQLHQLLSTLETTCNLELLTPCFFHGTSKEMVAEQSNTSLSEFSLEMEHPTLSKLMQPDSSTKLLDWDLVHTTQWLSLQPTNSEQVLIQYHTAVCSLSYPAVLKISLSLKPLTLWLS